METTIEEAIVEAVKNGLKELIMDSGVDLVSDMVQDNPSWWAEEAHKLVHLSIEEASKNKGLIEAVIKEYLTELDVDAIVQSKVEEKLDSLITPALVLQAAKENLKGE